jgi:hypothetical protein
MNSLLIKQWQGDEWVCVHILDSPFWEYAFYPGKYSMGGFLAICKLTDIWAD